MKSRFKYQLIVMALLLGSIATLGSAQAQDEYRGKLLAKAWCVNCHIVEPGTAGTDSAPPFPTIANDDSYTHDRLQTWLADPHPPMPKFDLSRDEINAIVRYIESLRTN